MITVDKKDSKHTKFRVKQCIVCSIDFGTYRNNRKVCSKKCKNVLNGIEKTKGVFRNCVNCNKPFWHKPSEDRRGGVHKYCGFTCMNLNKKLSLPVGQCLSYDGYIVLTKLPDGRKQIKQHRYIMEQHIGRRLSSHEIVHHINENKLDNAIENLQIVTRSEHNIIHKFLTKK